MELPSFANTEGSIPELKQRIARTIDFIKGLKPAQIDGSEDKEITIKFPSGAERKFTGQALLLNFSLPNFYFHYTTAYDILRHCGVEVGKRDFMGTPVTLWAAAVRTSTSILARRDRGASGHGSPPIHSAFLTRRRTRRVSAYATGP